MDYIDLSGEIREVGQSKLAKNIRKEGKVPCVLYGIDNNIHFSILPLDVRELVYTPEFKVARLSINGQAYEAILKDVSFHPITDEILHMDFLALVPGQKIKVNVPIRLEGKAPGVAEGGKLIRKMRKAEIKCLSENITNELTLDISALRIGHIGRVRDLQVPDNIEVLTNESSPIALVKRPRVAVAVDDEEEETADAEA